jgi:hypothetical protein
MGPPHSHATPAPCTRKFCPREHWPPAPPRARRPQHSRSCTQRRRPKGLPARWAILAEGGGASVRPAARAPAQLKASSGSHLPLHRRRAGLCLGPRAPTHTPRLGHLGRACAFPWPPCMPPTRPRAPRKTRPRKTAPILCRGAARGGSRRTACNLPPAPRARCGPALSMRRARKVSGARSRGGWKGGLGASAVRAPTTAAAACGPGGAGTGARAGAPRGRSTRQRARGVAAGLAGPSHEARRDRAVSGGEILGVGRRLLAGP